MTVTEELTRLVAFPSISSSPLDDLVDYVADRCDRLGFRVQRHRDPHQPGKSSLVCTAGPTNTDGLVLTGHLDVVPVQGQPWTSDPFELTRKGTRLVGRGSADMKGFVAASLGALARIPPPSLRRELVLVWTHDEEVGTLGSAQIVSAFTDRPWPTACLVGEPTDFRILRMHPGHAVVTVVARGVAAHSSRPELGDNAIEHAADALAALRALGRALQLERHDLPGMERPFVVLNIGCIQGGVAVNIVPDRCEITVGVRHLPGMAPELLADRIRQAVGPDFDVSLGRTTPALLTEEGTPLQGHLAAHARDSTLGAATFATDGGNLAALGTRPLIFGPGSIDVAHQADEWIDEADLVHAVDVIEDVVRKRCA